MDLFSVAGGMSTGGSIGTMLGMIKETDPDLHASVVKAIEGIGKKEPIKENKGFSMDDITKDNLGVILEAIKTAKPDVYKALRDNFAMD